MMLAESPSRTRLVAIALIVLTAGYVAKFLVDLYRARRRLNGLPKPPYSRIWGHLPIMGEMINELPPNVHPHTVLYHLQKKYNLPPIYYLDTFPFGMPMCVITDADAAQQVTVQTSLPKHEVLEDSLWPVAGRNSLVTAEGADHKRWRAVFNPGFSSSHLMTLVGGIVDETLVFREILARHAEHADIFPIEEATTMMTVDIIGRVVLGTTMGAQTAPNSFVRAFRSNITWMPCATEADPRKWVNPLRPFVYQYNAWIIDKYLGKAMDYRFGEHVSRQDKASRHASRPIIDLAFDAYIKEFNVAAGTTSLSRNFKAAALSHLKIFMFAGHDTSSSTICFVYHELAKNPQALAKVRDEYDEAFGKDIEQTADKIKADPHSVNRLHYTSAIIKETLRLWPPASSVRKGRPGFFVHLDGKQYPTEGFLTWPVTKAIQMSADYWPDPTAFKPERWLAADGEAGVKGAWRPFEFGPRNCIGQELAVIEMKIAMALTLRDFDIRPAYAENDRCATKKENPTGKTMPDGERAYQVLLATAKPSEGMPAKVFKR